MKISDDKTAITENAQEQAPDAPSAAQQPEKQRQKSGAVGEYAAYAFKVTAVSLLLVVLLTCIIALGTPFSTMRVFNKLGMSERAVDFGERYISSRLDDYDAANADTAGNFAKLSQTPALTDSYMTEALYVVTDRSYRLMEEYYASGDTTRGAYYAERVEKYTRMYMSMSGISAINTAKSAENMRAMPSVFMRPMVYSYAHSVRVMNFRARAYLGTTDAMLYNSNMDGNVVTTTIERTNTFRNANLLPSWQSVSNDASARAALIAQIDRYVDYVGEIAEYLDVEFRRAGVNTNPYAGVTIDGIKTIYMSETAVSALYRSKLKGNDFGLLLSRGENGGTAGFTYVYDTLKAKFSEYAQAAADFVPISGVGDTATDERIHQLYWLQELASASSKLWYMSMLMQYSRENFGNCSDAIHAEYSASTCESMTWITTGKDTAGNDIKGQITEKYNTLQNTYFINHTN